MANSLNTTAAVSNQNAVATTTATQCPEVNDQGLTILFDNTSPGRKAVDFVFIHGLNGHPKATWTHATNFFWPWELRTTLTNSRVMTFGYNASVSSNLAGNLMSIRDVASALLVQLSNKRWKGDTKTRPLVLIGHSMGGLVAKTTAVLGAQYRAAQADELYAVYAAISGYVFLGVPHGGSPALGMRRVRIMQKMAKAAFVEIPPRFESALEAGSAELLDLADSFRLLDTFVGNKLTIINFVEMLETVGLGGPVVDQASASIQYATAGPAQPISANHINMVKFENAKDSNFQNISEQLEKVEYKMGTTGSWRRADLEHVYDSLGFPQMDERWWQIEDPHEQTFGWVFDSESTRSTMTTTMTPPRLLEQFLSPRLTHMHRPLTWRKHSISPSLVLADITPRPSLPNRPDVFLQWLQTADSPLFWVAGKPASGKSTLMKHIRKSSKLVEVLNQYYVRDQDELLIAYFSFFDQAKAILPKSREGLLRALLTQLLQGDILKWADLLDTTCRKVFNRYDHRERTLEEKISKPIVDWSWPELLDLFEKFAAKKGSNVKVFLLIDGLDEFRLYDDFDDYLEYEHDDASERVRRNVQAHRMIADFFLNLANRPGFKICLAARPVQVFEDKFDGFPQMKIQAYTQQDIRLFVHDNLARQPRMNLLMDESPVEAHSMINDLCFKADGVFLWVRLAVNQLLTALEAGDDIEDLARLSEALPHGLFLLYRRMLSAVLPQYHDQGFAYFRRVIAARTPLTELILSFTDSSPEQAIACQAKRLNESTINLKTDEIRRKLKSRCGGLLESVPNPALAKWSLVMEDEPTSENRNWSWRPHLTEAPIIQFVHKTAVEYLQQSHLGAQPDLSTYNKLLVSCLLRIKLIGMTFHRWEIHHAVKDAIFYAKRLEQLYQSHSVSLIDAVDQAMRTVWVKSMSAGRPDDWDKDPGSQDEVARAREKKGVPVGSISHVPSIWGPVYTEDQEKARLDTVIGLAFQGELMLYLEHKIAVYGTSVLFQPGARPLLAYAVVPRGNVALLDNYPLSYDKTSRLYGKPELIQWVIGHGGNVDEEYEGKTVWYAALQNPVMALSGELLDEKDPVSIKSFCDQSADWAKTISLLLDHKTSSDSMKPTLDYLWPYWVKYSPHSEPIRELFTKVIQRIATEMKLEEKYQNITSHGLFATMITELGEDFLPTYNFRVTSAHKREFQGFQRDLCGSGDGFEHDRSPSPIESPTYSDRKKRLVEEFANRTALNQPPSTTVVVENATLTVLEINQIP